MQRTAWAALAAAIAATPVAHAGQQGDAVTISWSGATFMRSFTTSRGISLLNPDTQITLNSGPGGTPITYYADNQNDTSVQLATQNLTSGVTPPPVTNDPVNTANYYAIRFEWHEQGSIEGVNEMINDQIGVVNSVSLTNRNGNFGNPLWINSNPFGANNVNVVAGPPPFGAGVPGVTSVTVNGHEVRTSTYNTLHASAGGVYDDSNPARPGRNTQGGQNRVQQAVSDVHSRQGFARPGTPSWNRLPGATGYGLGNPALPIAGGGSDIQGVGTAGARHQFNVVNIANMPTSQVDPTTGSNYAAGPWNTAADDNLDNRIVAIGGMSYVANPGTGLERINRSDNVWLHATGRLQNGADFNSVSRDAYSGTINSATNNIGLDTSWAVGENDAGNTNDTATAAAQTRVGPDIKFSGKTSGGQGVRPTVQNSRMGFGHLSSSDAIPTSKAGSSRPMRTLDYRDDDNDLADGSNNALPAALRNNQPYPDPITGTDTNLDIYNGFTRLSAKSIVEGSYESRTNQTYVTIKAPRPDLYNAFLSANPGATSEQIAQWWGNLRDSDTGIKGDNSGHDVQDFRDNILGAVADFPVASVGNPADQLLTLSYMLPRLAKYSKDLDGLNRDVPNPDYDAGLSAQFLATPSLVAPFNPDAPATITTGTGSTYGNNNIGNGSATPVGGSIPINAKNWLFGDFDQRVTSAGVSGKGFRDYSDLSVAQLAQAALFASGQGVDWNVNAGSNSINTAGLPAAMNNTYTKGDLIVLGDFDSDGDFDGQDLYRMARGTALAASTGSNILTGTFTDAVRHGVLRKNAALDLLDSTATAQQKLDARANAVNNPSGVNAFNKRDVNRDGLIDFVDAVTSDKFFNRNYSVLDDQLAVTGDVRVDATPAPISLVDVELNDTGNIDQSDLTIINNALIGSKNETWTGTILKSGSGTITTAYTGGTFKVNAGAALQIDGGTVNVGGTADMFTDNTGSATNGAHLNVVKNSTTSLNITAGSKAVGVLSGVGKTSVSAGASLSADSVAQSDLQIIGNLVVRTNATNSTNTLAISSTTGKIDIAAGKLIVRTTPTADVENMIKLGRNGGSWDGFGLLTSMTHADGTAPLTTLAVAQASQTGFGGTVTFGGQTVSATNTLVSYTFAGDADLNGVIDGDDFFRIDAGFTSAGADTYSTGDFNFSGAIDADDYFIIDRNYSAQHTASLPAAAAIGGVAAVPEPGSAAFISLVLATSLARTSRRRRR